MTLTAIRYFFCCRWYKFIEGTHRKQAVVLNDRVKQVAGTLIIREAKVDDSGKYLCVVNNSVGGESVETVLTVTAPLKASIDPPVQTIDFGRPAVFTCKYEGIFLKISFGHYQFKLYVFNCYISVKHTNIVSFHLKL